MSIYSFKEKWGRWIEFEGNTINVKSEHLYKRWRYCFEHEVAELDGEFTIKYTF